MKLTKCNYWLQVKMDRFMGSVTNELATITGLELTVAPRRAAHLTHKCATEYRLYAGFCMQAAVF